MRRSFAAGFAGGGIWLGREANKLHDQLAAHEAIAQGRKGTAAQCSRGDRHKDQDDAGQQDRGVSHDATRQAARPQVMGRSAQRIPRGDDRVVDGIHGLPNDRAPRDEERA